MDTPASWILDIQANAFIPWIDWAFLCTYQWLAFSYWIFIFITSWWTLEWALHSAAWWLVRRSDWCTDNWVGRKCFVVWFLLHKCNSIMIDHKSVQIFDNLIRRADKLELTCCRLPPAVLFLDDSGWKEDSPLHCFIRAMNMQIDSHTSDHLVNESWCSWLV